MSEEQTVSLVDVLQEDELLQQEASAVLAGSDSEHCSYPQGYVKRQALYACSTCTPRGAEAAGVCLACSYKCHEGHDLFELYTKRNFRCDCGNRKFKDLQCKLHREKDNVNTLNKYSQNFFGSYCTCSRPYPDPEDQVEDQMIQCVVCEDWLHGRHLGCVVPEGVELQEMVCEACMEQNPFLWVYAAHLAAAPAAAPAAAAAAAAAAPAAAAAAAAAPAAAPAAAAAAAAAPAAAAAAAAAPAAAPAAAAAAAAAPAAAPAAAAAAAPAAPQQQQCSADRPPQEAQVEDAVEPSCKRLRPEAEPRCRLQDLQDLQDASLQRQRCGAVFWPSTWRSQLCSCSRCQERLSAAGLSFLLDDSDTVLAYENKGKSSEDRQQGHDPLMSALDNLNHVQQLEIIHGFNDMKTELKDFLQGFAAEGRVVTSDDIHHFFQQQSEKRRRDSCA